jgi:multidrug efflux system outer membrane protein
MIRRHSLIALALVLLTGCAVGPKYKRPTISTPEAYRGLAPDAGQQTQASLADEKWWAVFQDQQLQELIRTALTQNYDVRIAATRILQAQAILGITRADQYPTISGGASAANIRAQRTKVTPEFNTSANEVNLSLAWELDFWGKFRRATEAARANLLATEWGQRAVISTLVSDVATAYFQLLELDLQLQISKGTLDSRKESLNLVEVRAKGGVTGLLDVRQSEQLVYTAAASIPDLERRIEQQENFLSILLGNNPGPITRGKPLVEIPILPTVPAGLPSSLLDKRPDIQAEPSSNGLVHRARRLLELWWPTDTTHFHRWKDTIERPVDRSAEAGSHSGLSANHPTSVPGSFRFARGLPQESGVPATAAAGNDCRPRCHQAGECPLQRWR